MCVCVCENSFEKSSFQRFLLEVLVPIPGMIVLKIASCMA